MGRCWCSYAGRRAASTKTRIETERDPKDRCRRTHVAGRHPLKQGLKPSCRKCYIPVESSRRAASTKTRIETQCPGCGHIWDASGRRAASTKTRIETYIVGSSSLYLFCRRAASTKTRIETITGAKDDRWDPVVAGRHPLKQGLKHSPETSITGVASSQGGIH